MPNAFSHLTVGAITDVGVKRKNNEDSIVTIPDHGVFCVADGMGGAQGGEVASQATVTCLKNAFGALDSPDDVAGAHNKGTVIDGALNRASRWIKDRADKKGTKGTGSTVVVIAFDGRNPGMAQILHAGDSRAYRLRDGDLVQLSRDHTVANEAGVTDESQLPAMFKGVVTRAVGVNARVELERTDVDVSVGDLILLASDGLDKLMPDADIHEYMTRGKDGDLQELAQALVDETNNRGGVDNVSVIVIKVGEADEATLVGGTDADDKMEVAIKSARGERQTGDDDDRPTGDGAVTESDTLEGFAPSSDADDFLGSDLLSRDSDGIIVGDDERDTDEDFHPSSALPDPEQLKKLMAAKAGPNKTVLAVIGLIIALAVVAWLVKISGDKPVRSVGFNEGMEEFEGPGELITPKASTKSAEELMAEAERLLAGDGDEEEPAPEPETQPEPEPPEAAVTAAEMAAAAAAEAAEASAAAKAAEEAARMAAENAAMARKNQDAYQDAADRLRKRIPRRLATSNDIDAALSALKLVDTFEAKTWPDVEPDQHARNVAAMRSTTGEAWTEYLGRTRKALVRDVQEGGEAPGVAELRQRARNAPALVALAPDVYDDAVRALDEAVAMRDGKANFARALTDLQGRLPPRIEDGDTLAAAEGVLADLAKWDGVAWPGVESGEPARAAAQLRSDAVMRGDAYVASLQKGILAAFEAGEDGEALAKPLTAMAGGAPLLVALLGDAYTDARDAVTRAHRAHLEKADYAAALKRFDSQLPAGLATPEDLKNAEGAALTWLDSAERTWPGVDAEEARRAFDDRRKALADLVDARVKSLRDEALGAFAGQEDGSAAAAALRGMGAAAPTLSGWVSDELGAAVAEVDAAETTWRDLRRFLEATDRIHGAIPAAIVDAGTLTSAEKAAEAYGAVTEREWSNVAEAERSRALDQLRNILVDRLTTYVEAREQAAVAAYAAMEDGSGDETALKDVGAAAPKLVALSGDRYATAVTAVTKAREARDEAKAKAMAEAARLAKEKAEREAKEKRERAMAAATSARDSFPARVDAALVDGAWGEVRTWVEGQQEVAPDLVASSDRASTYAAWLKAWDAAKANPDGLDAELSALIEAVEGVFRDAGLAAPAVDPAPLPGDPVQKANAFMARRHALQDQVLSRVTAEAKNLRSQSSLLGDHPEVVLERVWIISGYGDVAREKTQGLAGELHGAFAHIDGVLAWVDRVPEGPAPVALLGQAPLGDLEKVSAVYDKVWDAIYEVTQAIPNQMTAWRNWEEPPGSAVRTIEELLNDLEDFQHYVYLDRTEWDDPDDVRAWRTRGPQESFAELIRTINKVQPLIAAKQAANR